MSHAFTRRALIGSATAGTALGLAATGASRPALAASPVPPPSTVGDLFGPPSGLAQLSRNENPFGPSPKALQALTQASGHGAYYADRGVAYLTDMIAERFGLAPDHVIVSSGSTEVLCCASMALAKQGAILCPDLFWDTTVTYAEKKGAKLKRVPLAPDMGIDLAAMKAAITPDIGLIHICNPNNPTAMSLDGDTLRAFIRGVDPAITVLVDEAYMELTARPEYTSMVDLLAERENLIICRTFSKIYGMAGLRLGYALTSPAMVEKLRGYLMSFGGNSAGLAAGIASYQDEAFLSYSKARILEAREAIMDAVGTAGLTALPSDASFVYVQVPDADALKVEMAKAQVAIRPAYGTWTQYSRVSTGRMEDVARYADVLRRTYKA